MRGRRKELIITRWWMCRSCYSLSLTHTHISLALSYFNFKDCFCPPSSPRNKWEWEAKNNRRWNRRWRTAKTGLHRLLTKTYSNAISQSKKCLLIRGEHSNERIAHSHTHRVRKKEKNPLSSPCNDAPLALIERVFCCICYCNHRFETTHTHTHTLCIISRSLRPTHSCSQGSFQKHRRDQNHQRERERERGREREREREKRERERERRKNLRTWSRIGHEREKEFPWSHLCGVGFFLSFSLALDYDSPLN